MPIHMEVKYKIVIWFNLSLIAVLVKSRIAIHMQHSQNVTAGSAQIIINL